MNPDSQKKKYEKHIELAIQHVLDKVKNPEKHLSLQRRTKANEPSAIKNQPKLEATAQEQHPLETFGKELIPQQSPDQEELFLANESDIHNSELENLTPPSPPNQESELKLGSEKMSEDQPEIEKPETVFIDAEALYSPLPLENEPEEKDIEPEDVYVPPFNLFEDFVETELDILLSRYVDLCRCNQCRADIVALALQQLPAYYVTGTRGMFTAKNMIYAKYTQQIITAVTKGIHIIYKRPRSNCKKIKQYIWVKPNLEEINTHQSSELALFESIYDDDVELEFSDEIADIIRTLENSDLHNEETTALLPVTSPHVAKAYQNTENTSPSSQIELVPEEEVNSDLPLEDTTMQLIDDWD